MISNLCDNAIKYNRPGGRVTISVSRSDRGAELSVSDTGIGIPPEDQSRVFERFYRVDKSHPKPSEAPVWDCPLSSTGRPSTGPTSPWRANRTAGPPSASPSPAKT